MGLFLSNRDGGKTDELGHIYALKHVFSGDIISGFVTTQSGTPALSVDLGEGVALVTDGDKKYEVWSDATETLAITTPNVSNPRIDLVVGYVDLDETVQNTDPNNEDLFKVVVVAGTPAGSPSVPSSGQIQSAIGASNPYIIIAQIAVGAGVTTITNGNITDRRTMVGLNTDNIKETKSGSFILYDADGNEYVKLSKVASAVNELTLKNAATGNAPEVQATGGDTNIDLNLVSKGTGEIQLNGIDMSGGWTAYTPTTTGVTLGNGTYYCAYKQIGKTVFVRFKLSFGSTTSFPGTPKFSLPVTAKSSVVQGYAGGGLRILDSGVAGYPGVVYLETSTVFLVFGTSSLGTYAGEYGLASTVPFTWGTNDALQGIFAYEAA